MTYELIHQIIKEVISEIIKSAEQFNSEFSEESISHFKSELKIIRSFMETIRLHRGDRGMKMPDKCKRLYQLAGAICEASTGLKGLVAQKNIPQEKAHQYEELIRVATIEWRKEYSQSILLKLEKQLLEYNYAKVPQVVINNFTNRQISHLELGKEHE